MASLLHNLLLDLKRRGQFVLKELAALETTLPGNFDKHRTEAVGRIKRASSMVEHMLRDPDLANPHLEPNFFIDFKRLSELILNIEDSSLLILKRCSQEDRFLSALLRQICDEVSYSDPPPLCGALSFQYFQALIEMDIILTPQTQAGELLALPDLYHELAHFVVFRQRAILEVRMLGLIHKFFTGSLRRGRQKGLPKASLRNMEDNYALWIGSWHVEFACDMIATYWCGPAYGWANLRLSATRGDPYQDSATHPADDARRAGIACVLRLAGENKAADEIDRMWQDLRRLSPSAQPPGYLKRYPARLLEEVGQCVYQLCVDLGFQRYSEQQRGGALVGCAVAGAWAAFQRDAAAFPAHESVALAALRAKLAVT
jgi:hypothetical protein